MSIRSRLILAAILSVALAASVTGLDWGLPYQWHTDEKVTQALNVLRSPRWDPDYFINPHLHIYVVAAAFKVAYLRYPGSHVAQSIGEIIPMVGHDSPARRLQFLAMRLARGESVVFGLATVLVVFVIGRRHWGERTGLLAAAFTSVTMGLVNLWHFATPEALLFLLMLAALWSLDALIVRGSLRDYLVAGAFVGLACSTKYTAWLLVVPFLAAHIASRGIRRAFTARGVALLALIGVVTVLAFLAGTPLLIADWKQFWEWGVVYNWYTGAPTGDLLTVKRSYLPYLQLLGDGMGWPLFAATVTGVIVATVHLARRGFGDAPGRGYLIHGSWIAAFYVFYGLSPHHALRFIIPIAPSLALVAAAACDRFLDRPSAAARRLAVISVAAIVLYSAIYTARADAMFLHDTRYAAGEWLNQHVKSPEVDYFAIEAYLPFFNNPPFQLRFVPFVEHVTLHHEAFWNTARSYLRDSNAPIVDSSFYYDRYLENPSGFPERDEFYRFLLTGTDPSGMKPIARFTYQNPWWLNPRPERVGPEVVVFGKR